MKKLLLLFFLVPSAASAQQYLRVHTDLLDLDNRPLVQESELLSVILVNGYLDGELKAYKFDVRSEDVKWKPIPEKMVPDEWDPKLDYYQFDRVTYQGKYYELQIDFIAAGTVPSAYPHWWLLDLHGDVVSTVHSFPEASDSTTKAYLLENLAEFRGYYGVVEWYDAVDYYMYDVVFYKGQYYECQEDRVLGKQPDIETKYWTHVEEQVRFYLPRDLRRISMLYARGDNASLIPQMLTLSYEEMSTEHWRSPGLSFYYQDVVDYLARQRQLPLLYTSQAGYVGAPQLVPGYSNIPRVVELVQAGLRSGTIKPAAKDIADAALFDEFVKSKPDDPQPWWVTQDLITNDVWVSSLQASNDGSYRPFLRVAWKSFEGIVKAEPMSRLWNYSQALEGGAFKTSVDTLEIDTLAARSYTPVAIPASSRMYFIEGRTAPTQTNPELSQAMKSLWPLLQQAIEAGTIKLQSSQTRVFVCDQPFPEITFDREDRDWIIEKGLTLDPQNTLVVDSASVTNPVSGIGVQYKRYLTTKKSKTPSFEPVKISMRFFSPEAGTNYEYYFLWEDVVKLTASRKDIQGLIESIKSGKLKFDYSELVYGLVGEK